MASITIPTNGTFSALRYGNYRWYFAGQLVSISGTWMQTVALGWLVYHLTRSEIWLGVVACAAGLPSLLFSPFAGVLVDRFSRRTLLIATQVAFMTLAFLLALLAFADLVQVWHLVLLAFLTGLANAVDAPARQSFVKDIVGRDSLTSGIALNAMTFNGARIIGPAIAGILLSQVGPAWCFLFNALTFLAVLFALLMIRVERPARFTGSASPLRLMREGMAFSRTHPIILPLLLLSSVTCIFVVNMVQILPAFAALVLNSPIDGYSILSTGQGVGAVIGGGLVAYGGVKLGRGRVVVTMVILLITSAFGLSQVTAILPAAFIIGVYGLSMVAFFIALNTSIQSVVPDEFRGRVLSLYTLTFMGLSPFGALIMGFVAEGWGTTNSMALYALLNGLLAAVILLRWPHLWQLK